MLSIWTKVLKLFCLSIEAALGWKKCTELCAPRPLDAHLQGWLAEGLYGGREGVD